MLETHGLVNSQRIATKVSRLADSTKEGANRGSLDFGGNCLGTMTPIITRTRCGSSRAQVPAASPCSGKENAELDSQSMTISGAETQRNGAYECSRDWRKLTLEGVLWSTQCTIGCRRCNAAHGESCCKKSFIIASTRNKGDLEVRTSRVEMGRKAQGRVNIPKIEIPLGTALYAGPVL